MSSEDRCFCDLAPLYALDLLSAEDRAWVEQQIAECPELNDELKEFQAAVTAIPYIASTMSIAPDLKDRLFQRLSQVTPDSEPGIAASSIPTVPIPTAAVDSGTQSRRPLPQNETARRSATPERPRTVIWLRAGGAIAAAFVTFLLVDRFRLQQQIQVDRFRLQQQIQDNEAIISTLQQPGTATYSLKGTEKATAAVGSLVVNPNQRAIVLLVKNLPELPTGQAYRLWSVPKGATQPTYCGQFNPHSSGNPIRLPASETACSSTVAQMLVTAESVSDPPVPKGPLVMKGVL